MSKSTLAAIDDAVGMGTVENVTRAHPGVPGLLETWIVTWKRTTDASDTPYVVHNAVVQEDGTVTLVNGSYDLSWDRALSIHSDRLAFRNWYARR